MAGTLRLYDLGRIGVILDTDDYHTPPGAFRSSQNLHVDPLGSTEAVVNRRGLKPHNTTTLAGAVKGGIGVPLQDRTTASGSGDRRFFISRAAQT